MTAVNELLVSVFPVKGTPFVNVSFVQDTSASIVSVGSGVQTQDIIDGVQSILLDDFAAIPDAVLDATT